MEKPIGRYGSDDVNRFVHLIVADRVRRRPPLPTQVGGFLHNTLSYPARVGCSCRFFKRYNNSKRSIMEQVTKSVFETLNAVNCNEHTERKGQLTYLSWAWAWAEVKKRFPLAQYTIYEDENGRPYFNDGRTCWVKTGVTVEGLEHVEFLPIMDARNNSIPVDKVTSFDMNKAIQRSLTKACARHGLGLYIYAGEDLPEAPAEGAEKPVEKPKPTRTKKTSTEEKKAPQAPVSAPAKKVVTDQNIKQIVDWVLKAPEGEERENRMKKAEDSYEWPGDLINAFYAMVELS